MYDNYLPILTYHVLGMYLLVRQKFVFVLATHESCILAENTRKFLSKYGPQKLKVLI